MITEENTIDHTDMDYEESIIHAERESSELNFLAVRLRDTDVDRDDYHATLTLSKLAQLIADRRDCIKEIDRLMSRVVELSMRCNKAEAKMIVETARAHELDIRFKAVSTGKHDLSTVAHAAARRVEP